MIIKLPKKKTLDIQNWHKCFAFFPKMTIDREIVWLVKIERRRCYGYDYVEHFQPQPKWWEYRIMGGQ